MDSTVCEVPEIENVAAPQRRSIFRQTLPINPNISTDENEETKLEDTTHLENYLQILTSEKESWKKVYNEIKDKNKELRKQLRSAKPQDISVDVLDEEDRKHIDSQPNYIEYAEQIADLKCLIDIVKERVQQVRVQEDSRLSTIKTKIYILSEMCCD